MDSVYEKRGTFRRGCIKRVLIEKFQLRQILALLQE